MRAPYAPEYGNSYALVIGIDDYSLGDYSPLGCACNDAKAVAEALQHNFGFPNENVHLLIDKDATRNGIMKTFWSFSQRGTNPDDRLVIFYAGHGGVIGGVYGDSGFLVPCDAKTTDNSTLISWNELTETARSLFHAKHIFFVIDACFGGHAIKRFNAGAQRFVKDMLCRRALQVIASGKSDEPVDDQGGPRKGHSPFTGHLLNALDGEAADDDGLLTANFIMNYVYKKVGTGYALSQTPQYGILDGEGDFIFQESNELGGETVKEQVAETEYQPHIYTYPIGPDVVYEEPLTGVSLVKKYLSNSDNKIILFDHVVRLCRKFESEVASQDFSMDNRKDAIGNERLEYYEKAVDELLKAFICVGHWGNEDSTKFIPNILGRLISGHEVNGLRSLVNLQYYPVFYLFSAVGIAALAAGNFPALKTVMLSQGDNKYKDREHVEIILEDAMSELNGVGFFKQLPGHENHYFPQSEYIFGRLQPHMDDILFLGNEYETHFDRFEVLHALHYQHLRNDNVNFRCFPLGRFAWKARRAVQDGRNSPVHALIDQAQREQDEFGPVRVGLFDGKIDIFLGLAEELLKHIGQLRR